MFTYEEVRQVHLELSSYCNSSCPTCPRNLDGGVVSPLLKPNSLSLDDIKTIMPPDFLAQLHSMNMCGNYGDPIMAKDLMEIVEYISINNRNLDLIIHTNGGVRDEEFWLKFGKVISTMPRAKVIFSIDGLEDTNHLYRIGVEWNRLMTNTRAYIAGGGRAVWDFLVFAHNEHQIDEARALAKEMGFIDFIEGQPHGFNYNGKIRVVDRFGKFIRLIDPAERFGPQGNMMYTDIKFDLTEEYVVQFYGDIKGKATDKDHYLYDFQLKRFLATDGIQVGECMSLKHNEIYIDSDGGIHPCCYLGHINQEALPIAELAYHRKWVEDTIGFDNINALKRPMKEIIDDYFGRIEQSWSKTFAQGGNPMCVFKCGIQRPSGLIRIVE